MAASVKVCDRFLLVTNGRRFITKTFSSTDSPKAVTIPDLTDVKNSAVTKTSKSETDGKNGGKGVDVVGVDSSNKILASAISPDCCVIAVCDDRKFLHVYRQVDGSWQNASSRCVSKRGTAVCFTQDGQRILVADKSGDVTSVPVTSLSHERQEIASAETIVGDTGDVETGQKASNMGQAAGTDSAEPGSGAGDGAKAEPCGTLTLGHLSMVLDMILISDDKLIVTCDRDEKVRLSHFPDSYNIEAYCLGHTAFVSSLAFDSKHKVIMSGSGDCTVRLWSLQGKELLCYSVLSDIRNHDASIPDQETRTKTKEKLGEEERIHHKTDKQTDSSDTVSCDFVETKDRPAIQQLFYCESCSLLCVTMYRCSSVLVYKVTFPFGDSRETGSRAGLCLLTSLPGPGNVISMCVHQCVLWLVRQQDSSLKLHAHKMSCEAGVLDEIVPSAVSESLEQLALHSVLAEREFFEDAEDTPGLVSHLWKDPAPDYIALYKERKRQRLEEDMCSNKQTKNKRK